MPASDRLPRAITEQPTAPADPSAAPEAGGASRTMSVRLSEQHLNVIGFIGKVDGLTQGEVIRRAIFAYAEARLNDPAFRTQIEAERNIMSQVLDVGMVQALAGA